MEGLTRKTRGAFKRWLEIYGQKLEVSTTPNKRPKGGEKMTLSILNLFRKKILPHN
jgi:hypothetical protein